ncbi:MAG: OmpA family protein [Sulfuricurvum sp.]|nr:OmpA family protein [Sulfuricurvum sp.]
MQRNIVTILMGLGLSWGSLCADVSEMIFYPQADFSEGILHFNYQGVKNKNYGFMFDRGFDPERIVYVRPEGHTVEKLKDGTIKLTFPNTDRYSYIQRAYKDDFLVSDTNGIIKILLSGGDCKSSPNCVTAENILTVDVPKGYGVRKYQGLDQDLKPLKNPQWQQKGNVYTLFARDVKGACIMMELEKLKPGQIQPPVVMASSTETPRLSEKPKVIDKPVEKTPAPIEVKPEVVAIAGPEKETPVPEVVKPEIVQPISPVVVAVEPKSEKPSGIGASSAEKSPVAPEEYFRNFQLFQSRIVALSDAGKARLDGWVKAFKAGKYHSVTINSYTDNIPPQRLKAQYATNEILSEARGKMVADYLASQGIDAKSITVNGKGDADPVASNDTEEGRSKNRRVEFIVN